jgi:hypothetical protein
MEKSHGEILREEISKLGKPISQVAKELGITRAWLYKLFEKEVFSPKDAETVSKIVSFAIRVDYVALKPANTIENEENPEFWKGQYHSLLVKYVTLLEENNNLMKRINKENSKR